MPVCWVYQWKRYTVFRMDIKDRATARKKFEIVYGFHGSDEGTLKKIVQQGTVAAAPRPQDGHTLKTTVTTGLAAYKFQCQPERMADDFPTFFGGFIGISISG